MGVRGMDVPVVEGRIPDARRGGRRRTARRGGARVARVPGSRRARGRRPRPLRRRGRLGRARHSRTGARLPRRHVRVLVIEAVAFDLDGLLIDSEQVWDAVREQYVTERGRRYDAEVQRALMGMSSLEWSRYLHEA